MIIHDLNAEEAVKLGLTMDGEEVVAKTEEIHNCIGCFGCWVKTPGKCVIHDKYNNMGELLSKNEDIKIISKCFYGGYSPFIKSVIDRCNAYILPDFLIRKGEMHHKSRYENKIKLTVYFYGDDITENEKKTAIKLINANAENLNCLVNKIGFLSKKEMMEGKYNEYWSC